MKIVFESNTGHTQTYANMLAKRLNIEAVSLENLKKEPKQEEDILFLGWVMANKIQGYVKVKKNAHLVGVVAVGMNFPSEENKKVLETTNLIEEPFFYLQGGVDFTKLKGIKKRLFNLVGKKIINENKPENQELISIFQKGGNFIKEENIEQIVKYFQNK